MAAAKIRNPIEMTYTYLCVLRGNQAIRMPAFPQWIFQELASHAALRFLRG
jgi:hypothetical protein